MPYQDSIYGFINVVFPPYADGGSPLRSSGRTISSFSFNAPKGAARVAFDPILVDPDSEYFVGWVSSQGLIGLADSITDYSPSRSYVLRGQIPEELRVDLGLRVGFLCESSPPPHDSLDISIELQWKEPNTDLDLYLVLPQGDTISWYRDPNHQYLDVDDNDGYGPERMRYVYRSTTDASLQVGVHYYGPESAGSVDARVVLDVNGRISTTNWCSLSPYDWWGAAVITSGGSVFSDTTCVTRQERQLSELTK